VRELRDRSYPPLAAIANRWMEALGDATRFPAALREFTVECRAAGQHKATPLLLHYETGGYNCLHQDLYGDLAFPLQLVCSLSEPDADYTGGDFLLVEQRPRAQSIGHAIHGRRGEAVVFTTRYRPVKGARGFYRANVKHGVSPLLSGAPVHAGHHLSRRALGPILFTVVGQTIAFRGLPPSERRHAGLQAARFKLISLARSVRGGRADQGVRPTRPC
jgi:hypothetical protein